MTTIRREQKKADLVSDPPSVNWFSQLRAGWSDLDIVQGYAILGKV